MSLEDIEYDLRIGKTKFLEWVSRGLMPQPWIKDGGVSRWLAVQVLDAIENFPNRDELNSERERQSDDQGHKASPWSDQRAK